MTLEAVKLEGTYFRRGNQRFLPLGAHWVPARAGLQWPLAWDPQDIEKDFARMAELGFNTVRFDLFWAWFEPRPGDFNPEAFQQLDTLIDLAHRHQIYLHPTLFIGGEVGEAYWDVPWRHGRHPMSDPEMLRLQTEHAAELARRYCGESAILAWDLTDEPPYWMVRAPHTTDAMGINWTRLIAGAIRRSDSAHLICVGTDQEDVRRGPFRPDNIVDEVDFFSVHPYPIYLPKLFPDPMVSERATYCGAFQVTLSKGAGRPVMVHELGASSAQYKPEAIASYDRTAIYSALAAGSNGFVLWDYTDASPEAWKRVPYKITPHETQFGLTTWEREDRPAGAEFRKFNRLVSQMNLAGVEPEPAQVGLLVPTLWAKPDGDYSQTGLQRPAPGQYVTLHLNDQIVSGLPPRDFHDDNLVLVGAWLSTFISLRRAGLKVAMPREHAAWQSYPAIWLPSPLTSTMSDLIHVNTTFWDQARDYVHDGGLLYASVSADAAIPEMSDLFGAQMVDHDPLDAVSITVEKDFGSLEEGTVVRFWPAASNPRHWGATLDLHGAEVIATDQKGRPALVTHRFGQGRTLLSAYPLEILSAARPAAFEGGDELTWRIYRALADVAGLHAYFATDHPAVEVGTLKGERRGFAVLVNHSAETVKTALHTTLSVRSLTVLHPEGGKQALDVGKPPEIAIDGWDGLILEWEE
jgi:beta-galactosidase